MAERFKPEPTPQTLKLAKALESRGVKLEIEHWDGHKHVDIFIPSAKLYIEINGLSHYTDPAIVMADIKRAHFSDGDDFFTIPITNQLIDNHLDNIAEALAKVTKQKGS